MEPAVEDVLQFASPMIEWYVMCYGETMPWTKSWRSICSTCFSQSKPSMSIKTIHVKQNFIRHALPHSQEILSAGVWRYSQTCTCLVANQIYIALFGRELWKKAPAAVTTTIDNRGLLHNSIFGCLGQESFLQHHKFINHNLASPRHLYIKCPTNNVSNTTTTCSFLNSDIFSMDRVVPVSKQAISIYSHRILMSSILLCFNVQ